uniref:putative methyltransferase DDB_G0268948 n=1 Tax=Styela clava TaxID=7725 RepID=UPI001939D953|nr:putative methyltransferase DDB_G0268948 [Styela clava]
MNKANLIRVYEGKSITEIYFKYRPPYPPIVPQAIMEYLSEKMGSSPQSKKFEKMLDVGCGAGQSTFIFAPFFRSILGIDISEAQIEKAREINETENISFQLVNDHRFPVEDNSIDLVGCGTAAHWLNIPKFLEECKRVLKPNGCCAIYVDVLKGISNVGQKDAEKPKPKSLIDINDIVIKFSQNVHAHDRNYECYNGYKCIYEEIQQGNKHWLKRLEHEMLLTLSQFKAFISTMGDYHIFMEKEKPSIDPLDVFASDIKRALERENESDDDVKLLLKLEYNVIVCTKQ